MTSTATRTHDSPFIDEVRRGERRKVTSKKDLSTTESEVIVLGNDTAHITVPGYNHLALLSRHDGARGFTRHVTMNEEGIQIGIYGDTQPWHEVEVYPVPTKSTWVKSGNPIPLVSDREDYLAELEEKLHELANDHEWCSEFDNWMETVGMSTRSKDYRALVDVTFRASIDHPSSDLDKLIGEEVSGAYGQEVTVSASQVVVSGSLSLSVYFTSMDQDPSHDDEALREAIDNELADSTSFSDMEVEDYSVQHIESAF